MCQKGYIVDPYSGDETKLFSIQIDLEIDFLFR